MTALLAITLTDLAPFIVFGAIVTGTWFLLSALSKRTSRAEERLARLGRPSSTGSLADLDSVRKQRFAGLKDAIASIGGASGNQSDLERNKLKLQLTNAGFRSDNAPLIYHGLRVVCIGLFLIPTSGVMLLMEGFTQKAMIYMMPVMMTFIFFTMPSGLVLYWLISNLYTIGQKALMKPSPVAQATAEA